MDMVINIGALKDGDYETVKEDISTVKEAVVGVNPRAEVKVIIETFDLTEEEKKKASKLVKEAGADFVKTSTGYKEGGATVEDVKLIRETVGEDFGVKAAGGVRNLEEARQMIKRAPTVLVPRPELRLWKVRRWRKENIKHLSSKSSLGADRVATNA